MRTRRPAAEQLPADELFRSRLENQIDLRHPLVQLSHRLPWSALEQALSLRLPATTGTGGRPALPVRLIAGLLYLKHAYDLSDEAVCERWLENLYWQFFSGQQTWHLVLERVFQGRLFTHASVCFGVNRNAVSALTRAGAASSMHTVR